PPAHVEARAVLRHIREVAVPLNPRAWCIQAAEFQRRQQRAELRGGEIVFRLARIIDAAHQADAQRSRVVALDVRALVVERPPDLDRAIAGDDDVVPDVLPALRQVPPANLRFVNVLARARGRAVHGYEVCPLSAGVIHVVPTLLSMLNFARHATARPQPTTTSREHHGYTAPG